MYDFPCDSVSKDPIETKLTVWNVPIKTEKFGMALSVIVPLCVPCDSVSEDPVELALLFKHMTNHPVLKCLKNNKKTCLIYELNTIKNHWNIISKFAKMN